MNNWHWFQFISKEATRIVRVGASYAGAVKGSDPADGVGWMCIEVLTRKNESDSLWTSEQTILTQSEFAKLNQ